MGAGEDSVIVLVLSEKDFDYELQALANSFFPGSKCHIFVKGEEPGRTEDRLTAAITLGKEEIVLAVSCGGAHRESRATVRGIGDWHSHADKTAHPDRTRYKNELKRLVFFGLKDFPEENLPAGVVRQVPAWGTMTGVRPTKIPMGELLRGKSYDEVERELNYWYCCEKDKAELCLSIAAHEADLLRDRELENAYSLYIGIPFCPTTCLYCSFPSYPYEQFGHLSGAYLDALKKEIFAAAGQCGGRKLTSIYVGGGTPTALSAVELDGLLECVASCFPAAQALEFTVEAGRPDSITEEKLKALKEHGVTRLSINPQTMKQQTLDLIGRRHSAEQTVRAFWMARKQGFDNINMDLIAGLPGEDSRDFKETLKKITELSPDSVTVHSLVVKRASRLREVLEETARYQKEEWERKQQIEEMFEVMADFAGQEKYQPYYMYRQKNAAGHFGSSGQENIGYARAGKECLYNILIMEEMQTIVALGAGASTKVYDQEKKIVRRVENVKSISDYIRRIDEMIERKTAGGGFFKNSKKGSSEV